MEIIKEYKVFLVLALVLITGVFFFFYHFGHHDDQSLSKYSASYEKYDKAISDFSIAETDNLESKAGEALFELKTKAADFRLSSLSKNDAELMNKAREIGDLSGQVSYSPKTGQGV